MFQSGKVNIVGVTCEMEAELAAHAGAARLNELGIDANVNNFQLNNIAAAANIGFRIHFPEFKRQHERYISHEQELFPGLFYRNPIFQALAIIFHQGKVIMTGAKCSEDIGALWSHLLPLLKQCRIDSLYTMTEMDGECKNG